MRIALTLRGALLGVLAVLPIVLAPHWITLVVCAVLWCAALLTDLSITPSPRRLDVRRTSPGQVRLGEDASGRLLVTNTAERPVVLRLRDCWNPTAGLAEQRAGLRLPPHERRAVEQSFHPVRRGRHRSRILVLAIRGRLGLLERRAHRVVPGELLALHAFGSRRHLPSRTRRLREIEGLAAVHQRGQGTEFDSLRDFVDGDDVRSIDWRATARRRSVVVRTWRPERDRHVLIVVDTSRTSAGRVGDAPRLDAALDATLLLMALASQAGDRVDVLCADRIPHLSVAAGNPRTVLHDVVAATAPVEPALVETDWEMMAAQIARRARRGALVVLLTPIEPGAVQQGLLPVAARVAAEHPLVIGSVADPDLESMAAERGSIGAVYRAASAAQDGLERDGVSRALERSGAHVVDVVPDDLPQAVADQYLALKAAGRL
ncbi:DUF58 domain-containing protein [Brachybacterium endophyticum]|uniref:DUF58 domain-containing protein n=1 Tax=Brachybacterium endophyticum TaxID=2182385 RepID=A0A2U2RH02_9MICO|nr:DUF58 domain-containing protein [Brachybacterium endophyticum]PWH05153.1 DUF58 domain-containing protein [Brachybacterium endophyticum]